MFGVLIWIRGKILRFFSFDSASYINEIVMVVETEDKKNAIRLYGMNSFGFIDNLFLDWLGSWQLCYHHCQ